MANRILSADREAALISLLDDASPVVQEALVAELKRLGDVGVSVLRKAIREENDQRVMAAQRLLTQIEGPDPVAEVVRFIESLHYELETGMILLNRAARPELDVGVVGRQLDAIAQRCMELSPQPSTPWERCKVINRVLFHEYGFRANVEDPEDPHNNLIGSVLMRRKGGALMLSVVYLLVAERCLLDLAPVSLPAHFLVAHFREGIPFYIDAMERGRFRLPDEVEGMLNKDQPLHPLQVMGPAPVGEVLCRACRQLVHQYSLRNNPRMAKVFAGFVRTFQETYRRHAES
ncbi:MAG: transglutaminase-like domain-containing protein [Verrucomicrobiota bacterium JB022]|nr:transglutaminase-like domain-containing protein [Verrucomicrobiota bacterium JB022]